MTVSKIAAPRGFCTSREEFRPSALTLKNIAELYRQGVPLEEIARRFKVSKNTISSALLYAKKHKISW